jgi:hypothetical protein
MKENEETYCIVRSYFNDTVHPKEIIAIDLSLEEAQEWCKDPETSSKTCTNKEGVERTEKKGPWFDGYDLESSHRRAVNDFNKLRSPLGIWTRNTTGLFNGEY